VFIEPAQEPGELLAEVVVRRGQTVVEHCHIVEPGWHAYMATQPTPPEERPMPEQPVVTVTATIMDGTVARWYRHPDATRPVLSASRNGVMIHGDVFIHDLPTAWCEAAQDAHTRLRADRRADLSDLATHRRRGMSGPLEPVRRPEQAGGPPNDAVTVADLNSAQEQL
jgi:hypothetical protein